VTWLNNCDISLYFLQNRKLHYFEARLTNALRIGVTGTKGPPQYSQVLQEAGASLTAPKGARRRRRRRMLASLGSLSPRQSYPGYAVPRDLPRLSSRQSSLPLDYPSRQRRRVFPMAAAVCLPACLPACLPVTDSKTYGGCNADRDIARVPDITRKALLYSRRID